MMALNRVAAEVLERTAAGVVHACTDITGFGLIGHASEMAAASGCSLEIEAGRVPLLDGARALVRGNIPGGGRTNREHFGAAVRVAADIDESVLDLLYDPQTSGGLLIAAAPDEGDRVVTALIDAGVPAVPIGRAIPAAGPRILVV
jgi:selenide,water dikinase